MRLLGFVILILSCSFGFSAEINIKNSVNLRSSPSFIGHSNLVGLINSGSTATVIDQKVLPSGNTAYKISTASIKPISGFQNPSKNADVWVYGSSQFVALVNQTDPRSKTGAFVPEARCENCGKQNANVTKPMKDIISHAEEQSVSLPQPPAQPPTHSTTSAISKDATVMIESLKLKGFDCITEAAQIQLRGVQCKGKISGYPEPVRIYIPRNFTKTEKNKMHLFFHGFEAAANIFSVNANHRNGAGDFGARLAESANNESILVVPESRSIKVSSKVVELTYSKYFQDGSGDGFEKFMTQISQATNAKYTSTTLSGHSGGYLPLNALLGYPKVANTIKRAALFDGSYYETKNITTWLNSNPDNKMRLSWVTNGSVQAQTNAFIARVKNQSQLIQAQTKGTHMENIQQGGFAEFLKDR